MILLERYIFRRAFLLSLTAMASLVLIVWIVQALQRVDIVRTSVSTAGNLLWIALMLMPNLAAGVLPFAVLIGAIQALNGLNADSERAVIAASGAPRSVVIKPILFLGIVGAALVLFNSHILGPVAQSNFYQGLRSINADAITLFLQPGRFDEVQDGLVVGISSVNGSSIRGLFIADSRESGTDLTYFAKEGQIVDQDGLSYLILYDGQLHRRSTTDGAVSIVQFQTYAFDLADLRPSASSDWVRASERSTLSLLSPDPNDKLYQTRPGKFAEEFTQRMTDWLYPIAFAFWALVVASQPRTNRQGSGAAMTLGLTGALVLKALGFVGVSLIDIGIEYRFVSYALPLSAIALNILLLLMNANVVDSRLVQAVPDVFGRIGAALTRLVPRATVAGGGSRR
ncbi:LptF/LptG family permease [Mangrovicella endophytica]|uniref:LptF/LptG family permease n=1 Tax=Mangrovicella endophytica TaxID=2066697 RepID=UPI000C9E3B26|nr:LptF/LptG family permease [Mangrovicella endophytica]